MERKRTSTFEYLVTVLSRLPWWASLLIGIISWLILRPVATSLMFAPAGATFDDFSRVMISQVWLTFAMFGQYMVPLIFLFGAITENEIAPRQARLVKPLEQRLFQRTQSRWGQLFPYIRVRGSAEL